MTQCIQCQAQFTTHAELSQHRRLVHQLDVQLMYPHGIINHLHRIPGHPFQCPRCAFNSQSPLGMQRHAKNCGNADAAQDASDDDTAMRGDDALAVEPPYPVLSALQSTDLLKLLGLAYHSQVRLMYCLKCQVCLYPAQVLAHFKRNHSRANVHLPDQGRLLDEIDGYNCVTSPDDLTQWLQPPVQPQVPLLDLPVLQGFCCVECANENLPVTRLTWKAMSNHHRQQHPLTAIAKKPCLLQVLFRCVPAGCQRHFPVRALGEAVQAVEHPDDWMPSYDMALGSESYPVPSPRTMSSWISQLRWDLLVARYPQEVGMFPY
jgi:hypothetical protein